MATQKFKTSINCGNCKKADTGFINDVPGIESWEVDTNHPDKILSVTGGVNVSDVIEAVEDAGFDISQVEITN